MKRRDRPWAQPGRWRKVRATPRSMYRLHYQAPQRVFPVMRGARRGQWRNGSGPTELKFHDLDVDDVTVAAGGTIAQVSCNVIAQGVTESDRIGRRVTVRSIFWRFQLTMAAGTAAASTTDTVRVLLYLDKQANGATAAVTDILESANFQSFNNLGNKRRFRTLMDRTYTLNQTAGGGNGSTEDYGAMQMDDNLFKKVNIPIEYTGANGLIAEITSNNIGVLLLGSGGIAGFNSKMRLRFSDL